MTPVSMRSSISLHRSPKSLAVRARRALCLVLAVLASAASSLVPACSGRDADASGSTDVRAGAPRSSDDVGQDATHRDAPRRSAGATRPSDPSAHSSSESPTLAGRRREAREDGVQAAGEWISDLARQ
jgi:hypothetical protein